MLDLLMTGSGYNHTHICSVIDCTTPAINTTFGNLIIKFFVETMLKLLMYFWHCIGLH